MSTLLLWILCELDRVMRDNRIADCYRAFLVQMLGAVSAVGNRRDPNAATNALHIYLIGVCCAWIFKLD